MQRYFVTSSGTESGKTLMTAAMIHQFKESGKTARALKPVVTGYDRNVWLPKDSDTALLLESMGERATQESIDEVSLWRLQAPLAPSMAAEQEKVRIEVPELVSFCRAAEEKNPDILLVEGIGGALVPLNDKDTVLDWMCALDYPVILVLGTYLGALSHGISTYLLMRKAGLEVPLVLVNETEDSDVGLMDTAEQFAYFMDTHLMTVPRLKPGQRLWEQVPDILSML